MTWRIYENNVIQQSICQNPYPIKNILIDVTLLRVTVGET